MSQRKIAIAVAGLGRVGWAFHCAQIAKSSDFDLVAVADPDAGRREEAERVYGCRAFADLDALLRECRLDALVIATPTHLHKKHALAAFRRGLHVLLEKPAAVNLRETLAIAAAARRADRILTVFQPQRAAAWFRQVCEILDRGEIGQVYHVKIGRFGFVRRNDWQSLARFGGGMLSNFGAHHLDQLLAITGTGVRRVFCSLRQVASLGDTEDVAKVVYETRSAVVAELDINMACVTKPYEFEAYGTLGTIRKEGNTLVVRRLDRRSLKAKRLDASLASAGRSYPSDKTAVRERAIPVDEKQAVDVYADLARAIRTGAEPFVKPRETAAVMRLLEKCRENAARIRKTEL